MTKSILTLGLCLVAAISCYSQEVKTESLVPEKDTVATSEPAYIEVEESPKFPGGDAGRIRFLQENINYPKKARKKGIQGTVYVSFIIEKSGHVSEAWVVRGIGGGCDEEAIRVIKKMPRWKPGKQSGKPVRVQFNMPLKFTLAK